MEHLNQMTHQGAKLQVTFPKSSEDHRLQLVEMNGAIFAIVFLPLESKGPIRLYCEEWSLILLAPLKSQTNIVVSATNVICLAEITSEEGNVNLHATNRLVKFPQLFKSPGSICEIGERGEFQFEDDPGALLYYYRLFEGIVSHVRDGDPALLSQAQQQFIMGLCSLAAKIEENPENLDLRKVLDIWNIPPLKMDAVPI